MTANGNWLGEGWLFEKDIAALIANHSNVIGGQNRLARAIGVTAGHLSHIVHGHKPPGPKVLRYLGYKPITVYLPIAKP